MICHQVCDPSLCAFPCIISSRRLLYYDFLSQRKRSQFNFGMEIFFAFFFLFLEIPQNSGENICARVSFLIKACNFIKKETLAQVFSCEFCEISKKAFFTEHLWTTASVTLIKCWHIDT